VSVVSVSVSSFDSKSTSEQHQPVAYYVPIPILVSTQENKNEPSAPIYRSALFSGLFSQAEVLYVRVVIVIVIVIGGLESMGLTATLEFVWVP